MMYRMIDMFSRQGNLQYPFRSDREYDAEQNVFLCPQRPEFFTLFVTEQDIDSTIDDENKRIALIYEDRLVCNIVHHDHGLIQETV